MINQILKQVKSHKKYKNISDIVVKKEIKSYLKSNYHAGLNKQTIKDIRAKLHRIYSSFQTKKKNKTDFYLEELKTALINNKSFNLPIINITNKLLSITLSTKERLEDYALIYKKIFSITGKPKIIIDLGGGFNLFSYPFMNLSPLTYYAYDINEEDIKFLNKYFKIMKSQGLNGGAKILDVRDVNKISKLPKSDMVFIFKLIDLIDSKTKKPKISELLIKTIIKKTKFITVSFPLKTIIRKLMNRPHRKGFELMLKRNNLYFYTFKTNNEVFYIISKNNL